jgi:hypothetical protein
MFRSSKGGGKRFDANAITLSQLQALKERLLTVLSTFVNNPAQKQTAIDAIDEIQVELNIIAIKYAI